MRLQRSAFCGCLVCRVDRKDERFQFLFQGSRRTKASIKKKIDTNPKKKEKHSQPPFFPLSRAKAQKNINK